MPRASWLEIGQSQFFHAQLSYYPDIVALFNEDDFRSAVDHDDSMSADHGCIDDGGGSEIFEFYGYESTVEMLQERLSALGVSATSAIAELNNSIRRAGTSTSEQSIADAREQGFSGEVEDLSTITSQAKQCLNFNPDTVSRLGLLPPDYEDPRVFDDLSIKHHLRFLLDLCINPDTPIRMTFTDLKNDACCFDMPENLAAAVHAKAKIQMSTALPLVVLTEGSTDASAISNAMAITHPHLVGYIQFMNFDYKPDSGTSNVVRAMRAMAAAGIPNRIVAILDNDAAGHEEIRNQRAPLPPNVRLITYPDLGHLGSYPSHGFDGKIVAANVNGTAASLELYFGQDILTRPDGTRYPVRWTSYKEKLNKYQGVVESKAQLYQLFHEKIKRHSTRPTDMVASDWSGMVSIIDCIVHAFDE